MSGSFSEISIVKVVRILRALRPLKLIKHNISLRIVVVALFNSAVSLLNVIIILTIVWLIFSILGISLLSGRLYKCSNPTIEEMDHCLTQGFRWDNNSSNFDSVGQAMVSLFIVMFKESWSSIMYAAVDAQEIGQGPKKNNNPYIAYYFIFYLLTSNFFLLNLFTVVILENFNEAKKKESSLAVLILTKDN